jgi:TolB protein
MRRLCWVFVSLLAVGTAFGKSYHVEVVGAGANKFGINLSGLKTGGDAAATTFVQVLQADLNRSGYFKVTAGQAPLTVTGGAQSGSGVLQVQCQLFNTSTRQQVLGKSYKTTSDQARTLAHKVADEIVLAVTGKKGMASGQIALVSNRTGKKELYICDMDGHNVRQMTKDGSIVVGPKWCPQGKNITYTSYKHGTPKIYLLGRNQPIVNYRGLNTGGEISPDGKRLAMILSKDGNPELYVMELSNGSLKRMTKTLKGNEASPTWSPDGRQIAFVSDTAGSPQIYIMSSAGGAARRLTSSGSESVAPDWGPSGIAFSTRIGGKYRIAVADPSARTMKVLETDWADYEDPSWAPNGRHIVCMRTANNRSGIYLLDSLDDPPVALLSGSSDWISPACTP